MGWVLGDYVKKLLDERDWTAYKLSQKIHVSHSYVGAILNGGTAKDKNPPKISVDTLLALAKALKIPETNLLLAYKGIDPDESPLVGEQFDFSNEVMMASVRSGHEWHQLTKKQRERVMQAASKLTRQFVDMIVQNELERIG